MATLKTCFKCGAEKPRTEFYAHKEMADGLLGKCKECTKRDSTKHRWANIEQLREYDHARAQLPHRRALNARVAKQYVHANPERKRATTAVGNALRDGRLVRSPCSCGSEKVVGHHDDYSKPLEVRWMCQPCHKQWHRDNPEVA